MRAVGVSESGAKARPTERIVVHRTIIAVLHDPACAPLAEDLARSRDTPCSCCDYVHDPTEAPARRLPVPRTPQPLERAQVPSLGRCNVCLTESMVSLTTYATLRLLRQGPPTLSRQQ